MNNSSLITTTDSSTEYPLEYSILNVKNIILVPIFLFVILTTVLGNLMVIITVIIEKSLRTPSNSLIFSLAIADLIVGLIVMPMRASIVIIGFWPFDFRCDVPLELMVLTSMASVLHLVAIAIDRYIIVSKIQNSNPLLGSQSKARIGLMLALVWVVPTLYCSLPFLGWHDKNYKVRNREFKCIGNKLVGHKVLGILITYYIPATIIIVFYLLIYKIASKSGRQKRKHNSQQLRLNDRQSQADWEPTHCQPQQDLIGCRGSCVLANFSMLKKFSHNHEERKECKVAQTLVIITSVFLVCWSPFFILTSIYIREIYFPYYTLKETVIWFGLCNSALNPIIYAYFVPTFRSAFKKIIRFRKL